MTITPETWTPEYEALLVCLKEEILEGPLLARVDSSKRFYLKTDWSKDGMGAVLLQAEDTPVSIAAERTEDDGGMFTFDRMKGGCRLGPIIFFSRRCQGTEHD
jgi:hypothetical protein